MYIYFKDTDLGLRGCESRNTQYIVKPVDLSFTANAETSSTYLPGRKRPGSTSSGLLLAANTKTHEFYSYEVRNTCMPEDTSALTFVQSSSVMS